MDYKTLVANASQDALVEAGASCMQDAANISISGSIPISRQLLVWLELSGSICLLRMTASSPHQVEKARLAEGSWLQEELACAIKGAIESDEGEVAEILELAVQNLGSQQVSRLLARPLDSQQLAAPMTLARPTLAGLAAAVALPGTLTLLLEAGAPAGAIRGCSSPLALAICGRNMHCVTLLLASGADLHDEEAAAAFASVENDRFLEDAWRLLQASRSQRVVDTLALAALVLSFDGSKEMFARGRRLLFAGANPNALSRSGGSEPQFLLSHAAASGSAALVRLLLEGGALVQTSALRLARGSAAEEPILREAESELKLAVAEKDLDAACRLLEAGLDPEILLPGDTTLLTFTVALPGQQGLTLLSVLLAQGADPRRHDGLDQAPPELVGMLLRSAADVDVKGEGGCTAAMLAASTGCEASLRLLIEAGAKCNERDDKGFDAPMHAFSALQESCLRILVEHSFLPPQDLALIELFDAVRSDPEEAAGPDGIVHGDATDGSCRCRANRLLWMLCEVYPGIANASEDGEVGDVLPSAPTLLMESTRIGSVRTASALLAAGARLYPRHQLALEECAMEADAPSGLDGQGQDASPLESAWSIACKTGHETLQSLFRNALGNELLYVARENQEGAVVNLRAEEGLGLRAQPRDFEVTDQVGFGALDHALANGNRDLELWFCDHGARFHGAAAAPSALLEPVKCCDYEAVKRRLHAGAQVKATDSVGRTSLDWCLIAGGLEGILWECVEAAVQTAEVDQAESSMLEDSLQAPSTESVMNPVKPTLVRSGSSVAPPRQPAAKPAPVVRRGSRILFAAAKTPSRSTKQKSFVAADPRGRFAAIEMLLIEHGARFSEHTRSSSACLHDPLVNRDLEAVRRRCNSGGDCNVPGASKIGLAHVALDLGSPQFAMLIVEGGAGPDVRDHRGRTVIWRAVEGKHTELVELCLRLGCDLKLGLGASNDGSLAHLAVETAQASLAIRFLNGITRPGNEEAEDKEAQEPDTTGQCQENHLSIKDVSPPESDQRGELPEEPGRHLNQAVEGDKNSSSKLSKTRCSPDKTDSHGRTVLIRALELQQPEVARMCMQLGANVQVTHPVTGKGVLHAALQCQQVALVPKLLQAGALPDLVDKQGSTPLQLAAAIGDTEIVDLLLSMGALPGPAGGRAAYSAVHGGHNELAEQLIRMAGPCKPSDLPGVGLMKKRRMSTGKAIQQSDLGLPSTLATAAEAAASGVLFTYLSCVLEGAALETEVVSSLASGLGEWVLESNQPGQARSRAESLEYLTLAIVEDGPRAAASDLRTLDVPAGLVDLLGKAQLLQEPPADKTGMFQIGARSEEDGGPSGKRSTTPDPSSGRATPATAPPADDEDSLQPLGPRPPAGSAPAQRGPREAKEEFGNKGSTSGLDADSDDQEFHEESYQFEDDAEKEEDGSGSVAEKEDVVEEPSLCDLED
ncbi:unnamed protein product [Polarella glacialis]|uniref:PARP n=1 Tax=Polarella glacialis TaxID=89957 RepID=A0A813M0B2_POLGL|nr:unnamed protein product [Polarella glacialis]